MSISYNVCTSSAVCLVIFYLDDLPIGNSGILRSPLLLSVLLGPLVFGFFFKVVGYHYVWCRIDISSWWIVLLINMKWLSLSLLSDLRLKSTLSGINIATPVSLRDPFAWKSLSQSLTLRQCLFFPVRWVSHKQHMAGSCFLTQLAILYILIEALRSLTFSVSVERCMVFPVIYIPLWLTFYIFLVCWCAWSKRFILFCMFLSHSNFFFCV
jgi:hypothetical protein